MLKHVPISFSVLYLYHRYTRSSKADILVSGRRDLWNGVQVLAYKLSEHAIAGAMQYTNA